MPHASPPPSISWSKHGIVAHTGAAGLRLSHLERTSDHRWQLAAPMPVPTVEAPTFVSWSQSGTDLAVANAAGQALFLVAGVLKHPSAASYSQAAYNHMETVYSDGSDVPAHPLLTLKWLGLDKPTIACHPAVRTEQLKPEQLKPAAALSMQARLEAAQLPQPGYAYSYGVQLYKPHGPCHPVQNKQACVGVRRNGEVVLYHQGEHGLEYARVLAMLEPHLEARQGAPIAEWWVRHAAVGFNRDGLVVVATLDRSGELRVYRVVIDWGYLVQSGLAQKENPAHQTPPAQRTPVPRIKVARTVRSRVALPPGALPTHLDMVSPNYAPETEIEILVASTNPPELRHLRVATTPPELHSAFVALGSRRGSTPSSKTPPSIVEHCLHLLPETVASLGTVAQEQWAYMVYTSGRIDFVSRRSGLVVDGSLPASTVPWMELPPSVSLVLDAGFRLPPPATLPEALLVSPNMCGYVSVSGGELAWHAARLPQADRDLATLQAQMLPTLVAFGLRYAAACFLGVYADDILACCEQEVVAVAGVLDKDNKDHVAHVESLILAVLREAHAAITFQLDADPEHAERHLTSQPLQKLLSLQFLIGRNPLSGREVRVHVASAILHIRVVLFGLLLALKSIYSHRQRAAQRTTAMLPQEQAHDANAHAEHLVLVVGILTWAVDFVALVVQQLQQDSMEFTGPVDVLAGDVVPEMASALAVLPVVLGKIPRILFLQFLVANMKRMHDLVGKITAENPAPAVREACSRVAQVLAALPVPLDKFEVFLTDVEKFSKLWLLLVQEQSLAALVDETQELAWLQLEAEFLLVCEGTVGPEAFREMPSLINLDGSLMGLVMHNFRQGLSTHLDLARLYFHDTRWLGLSRELESLPAFDGLRKRFLTEKEKGAMRRCVRCDSVLAVADHHWFVPPTQPINCWTMAHHRACICGSLWVTCSSPT